MRAMKRIRGKTCGLPILDFAETIHDQQIFVRRWHSHPYLEIHYILSGIVTYRFGERCTSSTVHGGEFIIVPPGIRHHVVDSFAIPSMRLTMRWFPPSGGVEPRFSPFSVREIVSFLDACAANACRTIRMGAILEQGASRMFSLVTRKSPSVERRLAAWTLLFETANACRGNTAESAPSNIVRTCIRILESRCTEKMSVKSLARECGCSLRSLFLAFQKATGVSPWKYLIRMRIDRARSMLTEDPKKSLMNVALDCGFSSASHFGAVFMKYVGMCPRDFVRDLRNLKTQDSRHRAREGSMPKILAGAERQTEASPSNGNHAK